MRDPHAPAWTKSAVFAAAVLFAAVGLASRAAAQAKFDRLFVFGDSYADLTLSDSPASNPLAPPGLRLNFWRVYPVPLARDLGIPGTLITDVAVGGATADPKLGNPDPRIAPGIAPPPNLPEQVQAFLSTNPSFGSRDLLTINIGGNDIRDILGKYAGSEPSPRLPSVDHPGERQGVRRQDDGVCHQANRFPARCWRTELYSWWIQQHIRLARAARQSQRASSGRCRLHLQELRRLCESLFRRYADPADPTRQRRSFAFSCSTSRVLVPRSMRTRRNTALWGSVVRLQPRSAAARSIARSKTSIILVPMVST